jgi:beclin 1
LADLQRESDSTRAQIALVQSQLDELTQTEEADYWKAVNTSSLQASEIAAKVAGQQAKAAYSQTRLEALDRANVNDDVFRIYYDGHYATINGIRLKP